MAGGKILRIFRLDVIAIILSFLAVGLSYLVYVETTARPDIFVRGVTEPIDGAEDIGFLFFSKIEVQNLGKKAATDLTISFSHTGDPDPSVDVGPPLPFEMDHSTGIHGHTIYLRFVSLGAGESMTIRIYDGFSHKTRDEFPSAGPPYETYANCKEGIEEFVFIGLEEELEKYDRLNRFIRTGERSE